MAIDTPDLFVVEIVAYTGAGTETLRYATRGFVTGPNENPANTFYDERVKQAVSINRTAFASRSTRGRSTIGVGDVELANGDGALDPLLTYGFDGRTITIKRGPINPGRITSRAGTWTSSGVTLAATAARINDGDLATNAWHTDSAVPGAYVQVDYGAPVTFSRLRIYAASAGYLGTYKVRGSVDGSTWVDLATAFTPSAIGWNEITFSPATYRYWRAELTDTPGASEWLNEAEFSWWLTTVLVATMQDPEGDTGTIRIKLRDRQQEMNVPIQTTKYAGSGGLEGGADLTGKPKPLTFGKVKNVAPPLVDAAKLIYQVSDGAVASIDGVYDRGVPLLPVRSPMFVTAGNAGVLFSSLDGITWTSRTSSFGATPINIVRYGGGAWIAGGDSGKLARSVNGIDWTQITNPFTGSIYGLAYGNGVWIAAGAGSGTGSVMRSTDNGLTWSLLGALPFAISITAWKPFYAEGVFILPLPNDNGIAYSVDGLNWTLQTVTGNWYALAFGFSLFLLVGANASVVPALRTSPPANITWTTQTPPASHSGTMAYFGAVLGNALLVVVGGDTITSLIATSTDAATWTARTAANTGQQNDVAYSSGIGLYAVAGETVTANRMQTSADGTTWTNRVIAGSGLKTVAAGYGDPALTYANATDLQDNALAPLAGMYRPYLTGGYFRLGASPDGIVTADVTEGAAASDRTVAQISKRLLVRSGKSASDYSAADITALDSAANYVVGDWIEDETAYATLLDRLGASVGASWYVDRAGVFRFKQLVAPPASSVFDITTNDLKKKNAIQVMLSNDVGRGLPSYRTIVQYQRNYAVLGDIAASVALTSRQFFEQEWREQASTDASVQTKHLLAVQTLEESLLAVEADAASEASRRQTLRGVQRRLFALPVPYNDETQAVDLFDTIKLTHPTRFNLAAGMYATVLEVSDNGQDRERTLTVWGALP